MAHSDNVVLFGGGGFIGRHIVERLKGKVRSLTVVSRGVVDGEVNAAGVRYRRADFRDHEAVAQAVKGASIVYDLTIPSGEGWEDFAHHCIDGTRNLAEACLRHGVRRLIFTSTSDAVFLGAKRTIDERDACDAKSHLRNDYSRGKAEAEKLLLEMHRTRGLPVVIFRPFMVVGRGGRINHGGMGFWPAETCCTGFGQGKNPLPFVLVDNVADAMVAGLDVAGIEGCSLNLAGDVLLSAREYFGLLRQRSLRNYRYYPRNPKRLYLVDSLKQIIKLAAGRSAPRQSYRDMISTSKQSRVDCSAAKRVLGWKPNDSFDRFVAEAINSNLEPILPGDLRLERQPE